LKNASVPTLEDVAREARVSTATVSRCLNSPERVIEPTRDRVLSAVRKLGYYPNFGARALVAKRTNTYGAVIPTMDNAIFAKGIQAFQEALHEKGKTLFISSSSYREDIEEEQIRTLSARGADGLLLIGHHRNDEIYKFLEKRGVPALAAWVYDPEQARLSIGFDNRRAMKELAKIVIARGHRKIAAISAPQATNDRARNRILGIRDAMTAEGIPPESLLLIETAYGIETGENAFRDLMAKPNKPTVVMCGNDVLAIGALQGARHMGIQVPEDVSITGFDDIELASIADPELTTVHVPHREMGKRAAQMLIDMVEGTAPANSIELMTRVCMRKSLAKPRDNDA